MPPRPISVCTLVTTCFLPCTRSTITRRVNRSSTSETTANTATWPPTGAPEQRRRRRRQGADAEVRDDEREGQRLERQARDADDQPDRASRPCPESSRRRGAVGRASAARQQAIARQQQGERAGGVGHLAAHEAGRPRPAARAPAPSARPAPRPGRARSRWPGRPSRARLMRPGLVLKVPRCSSAPGARPVSSASSPARRRLELLAPAEPPAGSSSVARPSACRYWRTNTTSPSRSPAAPSRSRP